eukprot:TRINITY_DN2154_c0_g2_i2.p1 TRINITY_DN2154_c0_g2~~TRINITY_DN2154_c0_g2_i2.p1  ORF type:complete len:399 (+),score=97.75 TRINITY_DN2154_c0_g2_i2:45-1241(+)
MASHNFSISIDVQENMIAYLDDSGVNNILRDLLADICLNKPKKPVEYMINFLQDKYIDKDNNNNNEEIIYKENNNDEQENNDDILINEENKNFKYKFSVDSWFNKHLERFTFPTILFPIKICEAEILVREHDRKYGRLKALKPSEVNILADLELRLDFVIKKFEKAFIKLNHRSPKDVAYFNTNVRTKEILKDNLLNLDDIEDDNSLLIAWLKALNSSLSIQNGKEAIELLVASHRVNEDLITDLKPPNNEFHTCLCIRKFIPIDNPGFEFRVFVENNKISGISQYESGAYFKDVVNNCDVIEQSIISKWNTISSYLSQSHYIIDFAFVHVSYLPYSYNDYDNDNNKNDNNNNNDSVFLTIDDEINEYKLLIVELNPLDEDVSSCLFGLWIDLKNLLT